MERVRRIVVFTAYRRVAVTVIVRSAENENLVRVLTHHLATHLKIVIESSEFGRRGLPCDSRSRNPEIFRHNALANFGNLADVIVYRTRRAYALRYTIAQENYFHVFLLCFYRDFIRQIVFIIPFFFRFFNHFYHYAGQK